MNTAIIVAVGIVDSINIAFLDLKDGSVVQELRWRQHILEY